MTAPARSRLATALVLVIAMITAGVGWSARVSEGRRALADSDAALARGDLVDAILAARVAAEARCPGCTAPEQGFAKLERIAHDAELRGDDATAFTAWRAVRAALLATAVGSTQSDRRKHADAEIARFAHRLDAAAVAAGAAKTAAATEERVRATLAESDVPSGTTFALVGLGGIAFLFGAARFASGRAERSALDAGLAGAGAALAATGVLLF